MDGVLAEDMTLWLDEIANAYVTFIDGELTAEHVREEAGARQVKSEERCDDAKSSE